MKKILNFGSLNIDTVYSVDHIVRPGETLSALQVEEHCGGKGFNQSIAVSRAGASLYHAGKIGADGLILRRKLLENDVDCRFLECSGRFSGRAAIQKEASGENCILLYGGANREITEADIDRVLSFFGPGDLLISQNEISCVPYLLAQASGRGMEIAWNPSPIDPSLKSVPLSSISLLVINEIEGCELTGCDQPEDMLAYLRRTAPELEVVLTLGSQGAWYAGAQGMIRCPAYTVPVVDTTAAGDTFMGYLIAGLSGGSPMERALQNACAAALAVTKAGAYPSIPYRAQVEQLIKEYRYEIHAH